MAGLFISLEGGDGSGKGTQAKLLLEWLKSEDKLVQLMSFPRYEEPVADPIKRFLNGDFGNLHPIPAGIPYSIDRAMAGPNIRKILDSNGVFIADRFTNSNAGHNGAKFDTDAERLDYFEWLRTYEYDTLKVPKPDHTFILLTPVQIAQRNIDKKEKRTYTDKKRDLHEADADHLQKTYESYQLLAATYPGEFTLINTMNAENTEMRSIEEIQTQLRSFIVELAKVKNVRLTQASE